MREKTIKLFTVNKEFCKDPYLMEACKFACLLGNNYGNAGVKISKCEWMFPESNDPFDQMTYFVAKILVGKPDE
jgi:hypothetical protein